MLMLLSLLSVAERSILRTPSVGESKEGGLRVTRKEPLSCEERLDDGRMWYTLSLFSNSDVGVSSSLPYN